MRGIRMRSALGRPSLVGPVLVVVLAIGASACTGDDGDGGTQAAEELPVEVEGEVLDRRDDADDADDADETDDVATDADGAEDPAIDTEGGAAGDDGDAAGAGATRDRSPGGDGDEDAPGGTSGAPRTAEPSPTRPAPAPPTRTPAASPSPTPTSSPAPAATPAPRTLGAGAAEPTGPVLDSDGSSWTESSSTSVEPGAEPPPLTVATRPGDDAPQRQVRCQTALEAPSDRGLAARGTLTVSLRIVATDGSVQVVPRQRIELDLVVAAGQRRELDVSPARTVDVADVRQVTCVAELTD